MLRRMWIPHIVNRSLAALTSPLPEAYNAVECVTPHLLETEKRAMQYINLGCTGMKVSRICLGAMTYGEPQ